jgi:hypothetical protein
MSLFKVYVIIIKAVAACCMAILQKQRPKQTLLSIFIQRTFLCSPQSAAMFTGSSLAQRNHSQEKHFVFCGYQIVHTKKKTYNEK